MKKYRIKYYWGIHVFTAIIKAHNQKEAIAKFKDETGETADILNIKELE